MKFRLGMATREAYGRKLAELGAIHPEIVVVSGDLAKSTYIYLFRERFPDRFFELGISEQNMMGVAAGLALCGKTVFVSTFAVFATSRCYDQIRVSIAQPHLNVKIVASHGGITVGEDGASAQAIEDVALMCALPGFTVVVPADEVETAQAVEVAARTYGPFYIRTGRPRFPVVFDETYRFELGRAALMRPGNDVTLIANGIMVAAALEAADILAREGVSARVLAMATVKPIDREAIVAAAEETGAIVTAEEHLVQGALGAAVAQVVAETVPVPVEFVGIRDRYGESGKPEELLEKFGLTAAHIAVAARRAMARRDALARLPRPFATELRP